MYYSYARTGSVEWRCFKIKTVGKFEDAGNRVREVMEQTSPTEPQTIAPTSAAKEGNLADFFRRSPLRGVNLNLERKPHLGPAYTGDQPG